MGLPYLPMPSHLHSMRRCAAASSLTDTSHCGAMGRASVGLLVMTMWPTIPEYVWMLPQQPIACARLNFELTATSFHGNVEPSHAGPSPVSSIVMVVGPAPSIRLGGVTSVQLTLCMTSRCSQPATRPHCVVILAVPCSNLELSSRRVVRPSQHVSTARPPLQSCSSLFYCTASLASTYPSPGAPLPSCLL